MLLSAGAFFFTHLTITEQLMSMLPSDVRAETEAEYNELDPLVQILASFLIVPFAMIDGLIESTDFLLWAGLFFLVLLSSLLVSIYAITFVIKRPVQKWIKVSVILGVLLFPFASLLLIPLLHFFLFQKTEQVYQTIYSPSS